MAPHQQELRDRFNIVTYTCWCGHRGDDVEGRASGLGVRAWGGIHWAVCHREEDSLRKRLALVLPKVEIVGFRRFQPCLGNCLSTRRSGQAGKRRA